MTARIEFARVSLSYPSAANRDEKSCSGLAAPSRRANSEVTLDIESYMIHGTQHRAEHDWWDAAYPRTAVVRALDMAKEEINMRFHGLCRGEQLRRLVVEEQEPSQSGLAAIEVGICDGRRTRRFRQAHRTAP